MSWRGLVEDSTPGLPEALAEGPVTGYVGFDPTAPSLHVGSLLPILNLARLQRAGHRPIAIAGGGTGLIGDPSGKSDERQLLTREKVAENLAGIRAQLARFLDFSPGPTQAVLVDNAEWLGELGLMDFLRDVGKLFSVNQMIARESVRRRLASESGISFTEFSYALLQAYDFLELHDRYGCTLQMGGSDQWGNILSGADLIRRLRDRRAHGLVSPLLTNAAGTKFGKTEAGAVWLDPERTSPYTFYQFWLNTADADVVRYLGFFTFLGREEIDALAAETERAPEERAAQRRLAEEVTRIAHGDEALARAERVTDLLFGRGGAELQADDLLQGFGDAPSSALPAAELEGGVALSQLLAHTGLAASRNEARRLISSGGVYVNERRAEGETTIGRNEAIEGRALLLRKGKKQYHLVRVEE
ncbi:MAG TPA: tyrosine--tRNA ligase [Thermoanaerobaculia bacterium]|nr:tyrosine--tRNA ligase [Thermoanaerobaculia bacterium]